MPEEVGLKPQTERHSLFYEALERTWGEKKRGGGPFQFFFFFLPLQGSIHFSYKMTVNFKLLHNHGSIKTFSQYLKVSVKVRE